MSRRELVVCACLLAAGADLARAQNVLPNPEFHAETSPWETGIGEPEVWDSLDSDGCADSGSLRVPCTFETAINSETCRPYSEPSARISFRIRGSTAIPAGAFGYYIFMYEDANCGISIGLPMFAGFSEDVPATFETFERSATPVLGTQSVRVNFYLDELACPAGAQVYVDSLYFGRAHRIFEQDFESGSSCPMNQVPGGG